MDHATGFLLLAGRFGLFMAWGIGTNDVANAIGPVAAVVAVVQAGGEVTQQAATPVWILLIGATGIVAGLSMYGHTERLTARSPSTRRAACTPTRSGWCTRRPATCAATSR